MANDEHVARLKQGVAAWNAWRDENAKLRPDLSNADLKKACLPGANLSRAGLSHANLRGRTSAGWISFRRTSAM